MPAAAANATPAVWRMAAKNAAFNASDGSSSRAASAANEEDTLFGEPQMQAGLMDGKSLHVMECQPVAVGIASARY